MKNINELAELGKRMRENQKEYFRTRSTISLNSSKKLERAFDEAVNEILKPVEVVIPPNQTKLL